MRFGRGRYKPPGENQRRNDLGAFRRYKRREADPYTALPFYIPKEVLGKLDKISRDVRLPIDRVAAIILHREVQKPFSFEIPDVSELFKPGVFTYEAEKLKDFLMKVPSGLGIEQLILLDQVIELTQQEIILGLKELESRDEIEYYYPTRTTFEYHKDYRLLRLKGVSYSDFQKDRFETFEGRSCRTRKD